MEINYSQIVFFHILVHLRTIKSITYKFYYENLPNMRNVGKSELIDIFFGIFEKNKNPLKYMFIKYKSIKLQKIKKKS